MEHRKGSDLVGSIGIRPRCQKRIGQHGCAHGMIQPAEQKIHSLNKGVINL